MRQQYSIKSGTKYTFKSYISEAKSLIDSELSKLIERLSELNLHPQIEYALLSKGKRLRPLLAILSAESVGGNRSDVIPLALAFELMHTATLVHDDIIDQDDTRRGKPTVHKKWSVNDAILAGDALIALSVKLASGYGKTILKTVAQSALELCDGEHMDITVSLKMATEEWYFKKIKKKSASLFRAAAYCGTLAGGGTSSEAQLLSLYGENFGIAYQLKDDLSDLMQKENRVLRDLEIGSIPLPLIHCYTKSNPREREQLEDKLQSIVNGKGSTNSEVTKGILRFIRQSGSIDYCEKKLNDHLNQAATSISKLEDTEYKTYLFEMTKALKSWG